MNGCSAGDRLRLMRVESAYSLKEAASALGVTVFHLCRVEGGSRGASLKLIRAMSELYDQPVKDVLQAVRRAKKESE